MPFLPRRKPAGAVFGPAKAASLSAAVPPASRMGPPFVNTAFKKKKLPTKNSSNNSNFVNYFARSKGGM